MDEKKTLHENSPRPFRRAELICALLLNLIALGFSYEE